LNVGSSNVHARLKATGWAYTEGLPPGGLAEV